MRRLLLASLVTVLLVPAVAAQAQMSRMRGPITPGEAGVAPKSAEPPPLPGLREQRPGAIPSDTPTASLSPNDALFDAINRGDMAAAKDAMSRGADLESRNVLGLSPIDSAVDQGRNDIAFYLLSARGTRPNLQPAPGRADAATGAAAATPLTPAQRRAADAERRRAQQAERAAARTQPVREVTRPRNSLEQSAARAPAGGGGTPRPSAGFLGFDAGG
ncbi:hypothetical protein [Roseomonas elaeocarpi]|uniref:Ankyrin repeat domain-containing protein n=1 Tax=Roseomonas elaeocarpi TaxID=907779 RepID=A0ABV6JWD2_9PROT